MKQLNLHWNEKVCTTLLEKPIDHHLSAQCCIAGRKLCSASKGSNWGGKNELGNVALSPGLKLGKHKYMLYKQSCFKAKRCWPTCPRGTQLPRAAASYLKGCSQTIDPLRHLWFPLSFCYPTSLRTRKQWEALNVALSAQDSFGIGRGASWPSLGQAVLKTAPAPQVFKVSTWLCEQIFGLEVLLVIICGSFSLICSLSFK